MSALLHLSGVGKDYAKLDANAGRLRLVFDLLRGRGAPQVFQALDDVSFDLAAGESLGIIGENGAGKSTLLKIVAGVITPTRGVVESRGRVGALLELGSGFHPEYSGIANIDLAAALLGLTRAEIAAKRDQIIAFADIGEHIHDPIKHYSSGMVVRLGFAVATALTPDILITDEVLAVGDESFQKKCVAWMESYLVGGGTLLLCSHSMYHIQKLCRAALWLKDGRVERYGAAAEVSQAYLAYHEEKSAGAKQPIAAPRAAAAGVYAVQSLSLDPPATLPSGGALTIAGEVFSPDGRPPVVLLGLIRADGTPVYGVATDMDGITPRRIGTHRFAFSLRFPRLPLLPGKYLVRAHALDPEGVRLFDNVEMPLLIEGATREMGLVRIDHDWSGVGPDSERESPGGAGSS
ncbi:MAG TPA: ABC transporter ATP-binding protein [Casimicrobiaceae bacterium]|jgi:lipopolysaccharide transport system ATP-binding protein|nr:ABC transporter ATP-binding protein [Casimicrobiaceae bacterium]